MNDSQQKFGIVVQARTGSTRLKGKMLLPFGGQPTLLGFILKRIQNSLNEEIILATSTAPGDSQLKEIADSLGIPTFFGSEDDVLDRFVKAANEKGFDKVIRICADNPFLSEKHLSELRQEFEKRPELDYLSYQTSAGTPVMKSHLGFFAEAVKVDALSKCKRLTNDPLYREHVTNFVYGHPDIFDVGFLPVPGFLDRDDYRLTLDTQEDYDLFQAIFEELKKNYNGESTPENLMQVIDQLGLNTQMVDIINEQKK